MGRDADLRRMRNAARRRPTDAGEDWQPFDSDPDYEGPPIGREQDDHVVRDLFEGTGRWHVQRHYDAIPGVAGSGRIEDLFVGDSAGARIAFAAFQRPCVICGEATGHRKTTFKPDGRVHYRTYTCADREACRARREAGRRG